MLSWDSKYEVGNERIDSQHRMFLGLIVDFETAVAHGDSKERLIRILREIRKYAQFHFVSEENQMVDCGYPDMAHHAQLHRMLLADIENAGHQFSSGALPASEIDKFLFEWFALHTSTEDKHLAAYIGRLEKK